MALAAHYHYCHRPTVAGNLKRDEMALGALLFLSGRCFEYVQGGPGDRWRNIIPCSGICSPPWAHMWPLFIQMDHGTGTASDSENHRHRCSTAILDVPFSSSPRTIPRRCKSQNTDLPPTHLVGACKPLPEYAPRNFACNNAV